MRNWLKVIRRGPNNMTQEQVTKMAGISRTMTKDIKNGKANPSVDVANRIAAALGFKWIRFFEVVAVVICVFSVVAKSVVYSLNRFVIGYCY